MTSHADDLEGLAAQVDQRRTVAHALRPVFAANPTWRTLRVRVGDDADIIVNTVIDGAWTRIPTPDSLEGLAQAITACGQERWTPADVTDKALADRSQAAHQAARKARQ